MTVGQASEDDFLDVRAVFSFKQFFNKIVTSKFMSGIKSQQPVMGFFLGRGTLLWFSKISCSNTSRTAEQWGTKGNTRNRASYATLASLCAFCSFTTGFSFQYLTTWSLFSSDHSGFEVYIPTAHLQGLFLPVENFIYCTCLTAAAPSAAHFPWNRAVRPTTPEKQHEVTSYQASGGKNDNNCLMGSREYRN